MWAGSELDFDAQGNLIGQADKLPFGLSAIQVKQVSLSDAALTISGTRAGLDFEDMSRKDGEWHLTARPIDKKEKPKVIVTIARDPSHPGALTAALLRVFSVGIDDELTQSAPDYWRDWLIEHFHPELKPAGKAVEKVAEPPAGIPLKPGKVTPPHLDYSPSPNFTAAAKSAHFSGVSVIGLVVDASGPPRDVHIVRPIGMGLDEMAVLTVSQYRFKPAAYNGKPVPVEINIEVNFRTY
ncbi:MAG TPA: energy transducer TonB [Acidobacteriaceae bacterium]